MKLNEIRDREGATHSKKRLGRGIGSGSGKTAGRGVKGQKARSGVAVNGFEGGQMPLYRRLPKRGFTNIFAKSYNIVSLARIQTAIDAGRLNPNETITAATLVLAGVLRRAKDGVRLLGGEGEVSTRLSFDIAGASKSAVEKVERAGGTVTLPAVAEREAKAV